MQQIIPKTSVLPQLQRAPQWQASNSVTLKEVAAKCLKGLTGPKSALLSSQMWLLALLTGGPFVRDVHKKSPLQDQMMKGRGVRRERGASVRLGASD